MLTFLDWSLWWCDLVEVEKIFIAPTSRLWCKAGTNWFGYGKKWIGNIFWAWGISGWIFWEKKDAVLGRDIRTVVKWEHYFIFVYFYVFIGFCCFCFLLPGVAVSFQFCAFPHVHTHTLVNAYPYACIPEHMHTCAACSRGILRLFWCVHGWFMGGTWIHFKLSQMMPIDSPLNDTNRSNLKWYRSIHS